MHKHTPFFGETSSTGDCRRRLGMSRAGRGNRPNPQAPSRSGWAASGPLSENQLFAAHTSAPAVEKCVCRTSEWPFSGCPAECPRVRAPAGQWERRVARQGGPRTRNSASKRLRRSLWRRPRRTDADHLRTTALIRIRSAWSAFVSPHSRIGLVFVSVANSYCKSEFVLFLFLSFIRNMFFCVLLSICKGMDHDGAYAQVAILPTTYF